MPNLTARYFPGYMPRLRVQRAGVWRVISVYYPTAPGKPLRVWEAGRCLGEFATLDAALAFVDSTLQPAAA